MFWRLRFRGGAVGECCFALWVGSGLEDRFVQQFILSALATSRVD